MTDNSPMPPVDRNHPKRAASSESQLSLMEFMREFPDDKTCLDHLWRTRYATDGHTAHCPSCDKDRRFHRIADRPTYDCDTCGHHIHPTAGTIFHKSSTSLQLWFYAIWLITSTRCGISAKQLERELGVTYKTAWRMFNKIRNELMEQDYVEPLSGEVEADETWIGGKLRESDRRKAKAEGRADKGQYVKPRASVFAIVERSGQVIALHVPSRYGHTLRSMIRRTVEPGSTVYTDDYPGYDGIARLYTHNTINHTHRVYVDGPVHTQTIEGFFSLVKNGIRGVYHVTSAKWLQGYLNEYAWRYNHRDDREAMFRLLLYRAAKPDAAV
jgi:transposase